MHGINRENAVMYKNREKYRVGLFTDTILVKMWGLYCTLYFMHTGKMQKLALQLAYDHSKVSG